jgi:hypothetical protein
MYPSLIACRSRATSTSASHHNSEKITNELKSRQETIDKLVTSKNSAEPQQQQLVDMQSAMTESLAMANSELNNQCERLQSTVKEFWDPQLPTTRRHSWWGKPGWSPNLGPRLVPQMLLSKSSKNIEQLSQLSLPKCALLGAARNTIRLSICPPQVQQQVQVQSNNIDLPPPPAIRQVSSRSPKLDLEDGRSQVI